MCIANRIIANDVLGHGFDLIFIPLNAILIYQFEIMGILAIFGNFLILTTRQLARYVNLTGDNGIFYYVPFLLFYRSENPCT